jgi:competence protein ComEC
VKIFRLQFSHIVFLFCLLVFSFSTRSIANQKDGLLKIYFFDVGQGDAIFIEAPNGNQVLIDGGPDKTILQKLGKVMPFFDKNIDMVILTHSDADHLTGLIEVIERYEVKNVMYSNIIRESSLYHKWQELVIKEKTNLVEPIAGKIINLGNNTLISILNPDKDLSGTILNKTNNESVVMMLYYGNIRILLTGDIELKTERRLILKGVDLDADVIKIAHHGSKTSTSNEFLYEVSPQVAIIQVGAKNRYGHPSVDVLKRLTDYDIKYYRTDINGDIKLASDGVNYLIISEK